MVAKEVLIKRLNNKFRVNLIVGLIGILAFSFSIYDLIRNVKANDISTVIFDIIFMILSIAIAVINIYFVIMIISDFKALKRDEYELINAKFVSYTKKTKGYASKDGVYTSQTFLNLSTKEEIVLDVIGVIPNNSYKIMYMKKSKLGIAVQKV